MSSGDIKLQVPRRTFFGYLATDRWGREHELTEDLEGVEFQDVDFTGINFLSRNLTGLVFSGCIFKDCNLVDTNLVDCIFRDCFLDNLSVARSRLNGTMIRDSLIVDVRLSDTDFDRVRFQETLLGFVTVRDSNCTLTKWIDCQFKSCEFIDTRMPEVVFQECAFDELEFKRVDLRHSQIRELRQWGGQMRMENVNASGASFERIGLSQPVMIDTLLDFAVLDRVKIFEGLVRNVSLFGVSFSYGSLEEIELDEVFIEMCDFTRTHFEGLDFGDTVFLDSRFHSTAFIRCDFWESMLEGCEWDYETGWLSDGPLFWSWWD